MYKLYTEVRWCCNAAVVRATRKLASTEKKHDDRFIFRRNHLSPHPLRTRLEIKYENIFQILKKTRHRARKHLRVQLSDRTCS